jgi:small subunit ribosomal protein YMR-31
MRVTSVLRAAAHARTPLIKFIGKRAPPSKPQPQSRFIRRGSFVPADRLIESVDHTPHAHPASPSESLPDSFATYRSKAQQHGPLGGNGGTKAAAFTPASSLSYGVIGGRPGAELGPVQPKQGEYFDRNELPARFRRTPFTEAEMDAIQTGGASLYG